MSTPDVTGLSLGGAYGLAVAAGFQSFLIVACRQSGFILGPAPDATPAIGYCAQATDVTTPGVTTFNADATVVGAPDQHPVPGTPVTPLDTMQFVYEIPDSRTAHPSDVSAYGSDVVSGQDLYWYWLFSPTSVPTSLQADITAFNGPPLPPWTGIPLTPPSSSGVIPPQPISLVEQPTAPIPPDLLDDLPPFEQSSADIQAVITAIGNELGRLEAARQDLLANFFPSTAGGLLPFFEQMLGLAVDSPAMTLQERRLAVVTYMRRLKFAGTGTEWEALMTSLVGTQWAYAEHNPADVHSPPAYTVLIRLPYVLSTAPPTAITVTPDKTVPGVVGGTPLAVPGDAQVALTWTPPALTGGWPITGYRITPYILTAQTPITVGPTPATVVTGLTNLTTYTFTVAAINTLGVGVASSPSNAAMPIPAAHLVASAVGTASAPVLVTAARMIVLGAATATQATAAVAIPKPLVGASATATTQATTTVTNP